MNTWNLIKLETFYNLCVLCIENLNTGLDKTKSKFPNLFSLYTYLE